MGAGRYTLSSKPNVNPEAGVTPRKPVTLNLVVDHVMPVLPAMYTKQGGKVVGQVFDAISELPDAERQAFIAWIVENAHQGADAVKEARRNGASIASAYAMADYGIKLVTAWKSPIVI